MVLNDPRVYFDADPFLQENPLGLSILSQEGQLAKARFAIKYLSSDMVVADISCASGYLSRIVPHRRYIGVDHPDMIALVNRTGRHIANSDRFVGFDLEREDRWLDLGEKVNAVVSFETIEHVKSPLVFLQHIRAVMKEGASLILSTPNNPLLQPPGYSEHVAEYSLPQMREMLGQSGFKIEQEFVMGIPFESAKLLFNRSGVKTTRKDMSEERGRLSRLLDKLPILRRMYCTIIPYYPFGNMGTNMILIARKQ